MGVCNGSVWYGKVCWEWVLGFGKFRTWVCFPLLCTGVPSVFSGANIQILKKTHLLTSNRVRLPLCRLADITRQCLSISLSCYCQCQSEQLHLGPIDLALLVHIPFLST